MKCEICGKKAVYRFSPDLDIQGLGACRKHKEDMWLAYLLLLQEGKKEYKSFLKEQLKKQKEEENV